MSSGGRTLDVLNAIRERRSVRTYLADRVPKEKLEQLIEAGQWAPSPSNVQSSRFTVVQEPTGLRNLKSVSPGFPASATSAVVVSSDQRELRAFDGRFVDILAAEEAAVCAQNMSLAACALGLGSCMVASFRTDAVRILLDFPSYIQPILIVAVGFPLDVPDAPARRALSLVLSWETYQEEEA